MLAGVLLVLPVAAVPQAATVATMPKVAVDNPVALALMAMIRSQVWAALALWC